MLLPLELAIMTALLIGGIVAMLPPLIKALRTRGKVCVKIVDATREVEVHYLKPSRGEVTIPPFGDGPGRTIILHAECRHREAGFATYYVDSRTGLCLRAPTLAETSLKEDEEGEYRSILEQFNPETYYLASSGNGIAEALNANQEKDKWASLAKFAWVAFAGLGLVIVGIIVLGVMIVNAGGS